MLGARAARRSVAPRRSWFASHGAFSSRARALSSPSWLRWTSTHSSRDAVLPDVPVSVGQRLHGYTVQRIVPISEHNVTACHLLHEQTKAEHLHFFTSDTNNAFSVTFKTVPSDSTGVAHILEHTALCGSKKYPIRDPFFNMLKRSLNTYMNAYTASDHTSYPFSTQNAQDFANLLNVYMDATLNPKLDRYDFLQEGHRLEPSPEADGVEYKGVVYNEMKGAMSDANSLVHQAMSSALFTSSTYHHNSGGEPRDIPKLTHTDLVAFHQRHYHPSNARYLTYGNLPLENHLETIDGYLREFHAIDPKTSMEQEKRISEPKRVESTFPASQDDIGPQGKVAVSWLTNDISDVYETFVMQVLSSLLLDGPSAPMYKALLTSGLGSAYASYVTGYDPSCKEAPFGVGLEGVEPSRMDSVEEVILSTLEKASKEGFPKERMEAIVHQVELSLKSVNTGQGLHLSHALNPTWIHGGDPLEALRVNEHMSRLLHDLSQGGFLEEKIRSVLLDNPHRVTLRMYPDEQYLSKLDQREAEELREHRAKLSDTDVEKLRVEAEELRRRQEEEQDPSCLPTLTIDDVSVHSPATTGPPSVMDVRVPLVSRVGGVHAPPSAPSPPVRVQWNPNPTNGIATLRLAVPLIDVPAQSLPYVPLYCSVATRMGTSAHSYEDLALEMDRCSTGIGMSTTVATHTSDLQKYTADIHIGTSFVYRNAREALDLLEQVITDATFEDENRLNSLLSQISVGLQNGVIPRGHLYARSLARAPFSAAASMEEAMGGISVNDHIAHATHVEPQEVLRHLREVGRAVARAAPLRYSINGEQGPTEEHVIPEFEEFLLRTNPTGSSLPGIAEDSYAPNEFQHAWNGQENPFIHRYVPASVNFVSKAMAGVPYTHDDAAALRIACALVGSCYLHPEIREKGGAYGSGLRHTDGVLSFTSYRDPNLERTLDVFDGAAQWLRSPSSFTAQDVFEAKLSVFGDLDHPIAPSARGQALFRTGLTHEQRQRHREQLIGVTLDDVIRVGTRYLDADRPCSVAVFGPDGA